MTVRSGGGGQRRALLVGIDRYPRFGPEVPLRGAVRDAVVLAELLIEGYGFAAEDVRLCLGARATRAALLARLDGLLARVRPGDSVLFFFSGHGSQMTDREGDEGDGLDETLVPVDSGRGRHENRDISDDEIHLWASKVLAVTPGLTLIFDCCHAATLHRPAWRVRSVPPDLRPTHLLPPSPVPVERQVSRGPAPALLAACGDAELAYELPAEVAGVDCGAFSDTLTAVLAEAARQSSCSRELTWRGVMETVRARLSLLAPAQNPELSGEGLDAPIFLSSAPPPPCGTSIGMYPAPSAVAPSGVAPSGAARSADSSETRVQTLPEAASERYLAPWRAPSRRWLAWADSASADRATGLRWQVYRSRRGPWRRLGSETLAVGDRLRVDVRHDHHAGLQVYLLGVGVSGHLRLLFPEADGHELLDPGPTLTVGDRSGDALELTWPADAQPDLQVGRGYLILVASPGRLRASQLLSGLVGPASEARVLVEEYRLRSPLR
ncbi:MAG: caspase family protein [Holophagales bacterium]|nr:caspase family protein [Holophagales bacterium]